MNDIVSRRSVIACVTAVLLLHATISPCLGQFTSSRSETGLQSPSPALFEIRGGNEHELMINVHIWGQVHRPGRYLVPDGTDLIGLVSYAGGPTEAAKLQKVQLLNPQAEDMKAQRIDLKRFIQSGDPAMIPQLKPGDVVVIPASRSHSLLKLTGLLSVLAVAANIAITASNN